MMKLKNMNTLSVEETQWGGKIIAEWNNKEVGSLKYHRGLDNRNRIEVSSIYVVEPFRPFDVEEQMCKHLNKMFKRRKYIITYKYL